MHCTRMDPLQCVIVRVLLYDKSIDYQTGWNSEQKPYVETGDMQFNLS